MADAPPLERTLGEYGKRDRNHARLNIHNQLITVNKGGGSKSGMLELNIMDARLAQGKLLSKQIEDVITAEIKKRMTTLNMQPQVAPNHQKISWKDQQSGSQGQQGAHENQVPPRKAVWASSIEKLITSTSSFIEESRAIQKNHSSSIKNLETQLGQLVQQLAQRAPGNLSSDTIPNPRNNVNVVTTRSGKVSELVPPKGKKGGSASAPTHSEEIVTLTLVEEDIGREKEEEPVVQKKEALPKPEIQLPFPQRLKREESEKQFEALEQMSTYAKFMKEILSKKMKIDGEIVMLTEECNAIIWRKLPPKFKDPGSFSITCAIGDRTFGKAQCDIGSSVSLMPLSIYKRLGI
ncbi:uncharacterized protein [Cicer arietinum]|uniref:uncharacterized protein n=1 Tax=Cicer arietinum TaxID=3827 RepID=UPI003CC693AD